FYIRLIEQLSRQHLLVTDMQVLLTPVPDLPAGDLPFRRTSIKRRSTRTPGKLSPGCEHVCVAAWQVKLSDVDRQTECDIESKLILQEIAVSLNFEHCLIKICDR